jgi:GNAT superfamily N-acetyltransferase
MRAVTVRKIKKNELDKLLALYTHLHKNDTPLPSPTKLRKIWKDIFKNQLLHYFVIEDKGQFISSCTLSIIPNLTRSARPYSIIENMVTHSDFRRKGYGKEILKYALNFAWKKNCYKVMLLSGVYRKAAHSLYDSVGLSKKDKVGYVAKQK